ncbi:MAG: hypothetical protein ABWZ25_13605 [Chitinophagaceae bacterium]
MLRRMFFVLFVIYSCSGAKEKKRKIQLEGSWVPVNIEWKSAVMGDPELDKIKYSSFYTFSFKDSEFILIGSTNAPNGGDSIILASEPGYTLFSGSWEMQDSLVLTKFEKVYSFLDLPDDRLFRERRDTFVVRGDRLLFNNETYKPFNKFDTSILNSFWVKAKEAEQVK